MMQKRKSKIRSFIRFISMLLVIILVSEEFLGSGSIVLAASENEVNVSVENPGDGADMSDANNEVASDSNDVIMEEMDAQAQQPQVLFELEELRQEDKKQFRLSDGSIMAAEYAMDVHYQDEADVWKEIDNRFVYEAATAEDTMEGFATAEGAVEFKFVPDATAGEAVRISDGEYSVSFGLPQAVSETDVSGAEVQEMIAADIENADSLENTGGNTASTVPITLIKGAILNPEEAIATLEGNGGVAAAHAVSALNAEDADQEGTAENTALEDTGTEKAPWSEVEEIPSRDPLAEEALAEHAVTSVGYENIHPGVSLQYVTYGSSLKEYILVEEQQEDYHYVFSLDMEGLFPKEQADGSILFVDETDGTPVYEIPSGYMTDAAGAYSEAVEMEISERADGGYVLAVEADKSWINAPTRVFPVQIDPTMNYLLKSLTNIRGSYSCQGSPNENTVGYSSMYVGYDSSGNKEMITYIQMRNLPSLPKNSVICNAKFYAGVKVFSEIAMPKMDVCLKKLTSASTWTSMFTWNNKPTLADEIMEYQTITSSQIGNYVGFDITDLVKDHYEAGNANDSVSAFAMRAYGGGTMTNSSCANAAFYLKTAGAYPVLGIFYRDTRGVEGYYSARSQDLGYAGAAYVGDYNSQLTVIRNDGAYSSTILPYEIGLVYNSSSSRSYFTDSGDIHTKDFSGMILGTGWKLNIQETVKEEVVTDMSSTTTYLVYNDSDGTEHYFRKSESDSTKYEDEDGLDLTIKKSGTTYTMTDKKDNVKTFQNGYLTEVKDANGNKVNIIYSGTRITAVTHQPKGGTAENLFLLTYDGNGCLTKIQETHGGRVRQYTYGKNSYDQYELQGVSRDGQAEAQYRYGTTHAAMTHAYDVRTKTGVQYAYESSATGYRISGFHEYAAASVTGTQTTGAKIKSSTDGMRETTYTDSGTDRTFGTTDDITTTYVFNSSGQTINAFSCDAEGLLLGVSASAYTKNSGTSKKNNRMTQGISGGQAGVDMLLNGGFERYSGDVCASWTEVIDASGGGNAKCREAEAHSGKMRYNIYNGSTATTQTIYQNVNLTGGRTYTASAYVRATDDTGAFASDGGAYLMAANTSGNEVARGTILTHKTNAAIEGGWQRITMTFTPASTGTYRICLVWAHARGVLHADDLQLEEGEAASRVNYVDNASFEGYSAGWTLAGSCNTVTTDSRHGTVSFHTYGIPRTESSVQQTIQVGKSSDTTFLLSAWGKGDSVPGLETEIAGKADLALRYFGLSLTLHYSDGTSDSYDLPFNEFVHEWQYASMAVAPKSTGKTITTATLKAFLRSGANHVWFDNISLTEEPAQTYKYNDKGELTSVRSSGNGEESYKYDNATQNLLSVGTEGSGTYTYSYDNAANKHLPTAVTNDTVKMSIGYTPYGETKETVLANTTETNGRKMTSTATYGDGLLTQVTDNTGAATVYGYDSHRRATSVKDAKGVETVTPYDSTWDLPEQTYLNGKVSVKNTYTDGNLTKLTRTGYTPAGAKQVMEYTFGYDAFGNRTSVNVGSSYPTVQYSYNKGNGTLKSISYGYEPEPLAFVDYTYDALDRTKTVRYDDMKSRESVTYGYLYSSDGSLSGVTEDGELRYTYDYDTLGRLIHSSRVENGRAVLYTDHQYDTSDRITSQSWQIGKDSFTETYKYKKTDGTLEVMNTGGDDLNFGYDSLKRLSYRSSPALRVDYDYRNRDENTTTTQVASMRYQNPTTGATLLPQLSYTYDAIGNITSMSTGSALAASYEYDTQNQLTREVLENSIASTAYDYTYTYDTYGNIREIREKQPTIGYENRYVLTYQDGGTRKDRIQKVTYTDRSGSTKTVTFQYDSMGNPLTYYNGAKTFSFTWRYGNQLATSSDGTNALTYDYDMDGVRSSKTVNGVEHTYETLDGKVVRESYGSTVIDYFYDNEGKPYKLSINKNGTVTKGYYVLNQQGDVIAILNSAGNVAVTYTYNAWGKQVRYITSGTDAATLYQNNALKYRGYYYDVETGLYYVSSRYYDPEIGRFISADTTDVLTIDCASLIDKNLYAYCNNNPVIHADQNGELAHLVIGAIIGVGVQLIADIGIGLVSGNSVNEIISSLSPVDYLSAGISGALAASGISLVGSVVANATLGGATYLSNCSYRGEKANVVDFAVATTVGGVSGYIGGNGVNGKNLGGIYNRSNQVLKTAKSTRKIAQYTAKKMAVKTTVKSGVKNTVKAGLFSNAANFFRKLFTKSKV